MEESMKAALKDVSLRYAEDGAKLAVDFAFELINEAIKVSETPIDDMFLPTLNALKPVAVGLCDKIYKEAQ